MRRPDHAWLIEQIHERFGALIEERCLVLEEELDRPALVISIRGDRSELLIGVDGSTLDRWMVRKGRQVVLWAVEGKQHTLKHPYPACVGPGWRSAMIETIQRAITDALKLEESPDGESA